MYLLTDLYVGYRFADPQMLEERSTRDLPLLPNGANGATEPHSSASAPGGGC